MRFDDISSCDPEVAGKSSIADLALGGGHGPKIRLHTYELGAPGKCPQVFSTMPGSFGSSSRGRSNRGRMPLVLNRREVVANGIPLVTKYVSKVCC
jgi:hypothetical protein